jgi:hypothetical protein
VELRGDNATITYRFRRNHTQPWQVNTVRGRVTATRIELLPLRYDMNGHRTSISVPQIIELLSYQIDGQGVVKIDEDR